MRASRSRSTYWLKAPAAAEATSTASTSAAARETDGALLVVASLVPAAFALGWIYLVAAAAGGAWFLRKCLALVRHPGRETARAAFLASLVQLGAVLTGAMLDAAIS